MKSRLWKWKQPLSTATAQHHVDALAIMTISDNLVNPDEDTTAEEHLNTFTDIDEGWLGIW